MDVTKTYEEVLASVGLTYSKSFLNNFYGEIWNIIQNTAPLQIRQESIRNTLEPVWDAVNANIAERIHHEIYKRMYDDR